MCRQCIGTSFVGVGSHRLHVRDRNSRQIFLVDTGSDLSIISVKYLRDRKKTDLVLQAENNKNNDLRCGANESEFGFKKEVFLGVLLG